MDENGCCYISNKKLTAMAENEIKLQNDKKEKEINIKHIKSYYYKILGILEIMNLLYEKNVAIYNKGEEKKDVETKIWMKEFNPDVMQQRIDSLYRCKHKNLKEALPIAAILKDLNMLEDFNIPNIATWVDIFNNNLAPTYFKDNRKNSKSIGIDLENKTALENIENKDLNSIGLKLWEILKGMTELLEIYLGLEYATFGVYMARYGAQGLDISKMLVKKLTESLEDNPFNLTSNVENRANEAFYLVHNRKNTFEENFETSKLPELEGPFYGFVKKYLESIANKDVAMLTHTLEGKSHLGLQIKNLIEVFYSVDNILSFACQIYGLEVLSLKQHELFINSSIKRGERV